MALDVLITAAGICGGLVILVLLVVSARVFATRRRVSALTKRDDVDGLRDMAITSGSATVRVAAVEALGRFGAHECLDPLAEALEQEKDPAVRLVILETITTFKERAVGPLLRSWPGLGEVEKAGAVLSLEALGLETLTEALAGVAVEQPDLLTVLLEQPDGLLRQAALKASLSPARVLADPVHDAETEP
jgi:hypothetical protein